MTWLQTFKILSALIALMSDEEGYSIKGSVLKLLHEHAGESIATLFDFFHERQEGNP